MIVFYQKFRKRIKLFFVFLFSLVCSCKTLHNRNKDLCNNKQLKVSLEPERYMLTFFLIKKGSQPIIMSGIGSNIDLDLLNFESTSSFLNSFYEHYDYIPSLDLDLQYSNLLKCIGVSERVRIVYENICQSEFTILRDDSQIVIDVHKLSNIKKQITITKNNQCIFSNSNELNVKNIEFIKNITLLY